MLIIEDGTNVAGATSLVTLAYVRAFALLRSIALSGDDTVLEPLIIKAHDYLRMREPQLQGFRQFLTQRLPFPRIWVLLYSRYLPPEEIPDQIKDALSQMVIELTTQDLTPNGDGYIRLREKVGPIETEYQPTGSTVVRPTFPKVDALLAPLLKNGGLLFATRG